MKIKKKFLDEITKRLDIVSASGRSTVEQIMINAPQGYDFDELYDYVSKNYLPIVEASANNAAVVGASAYDAFRKIETGKAYGALPEASYDAADTADAVSAFVNNACRTQDKAQLVDMLGRRLDAEVMRSFTNSQLSNAKKDPLRPRFARVPSGSKTCAFCRAMAGHGFFYTSRETAGDLGGPFNAFHDYCRCRVVPQFSAEAYQLEVEGYDPDKYVEEWRETRKQFGQGHGSGRLSGGTEYKKITPTGRRSRAMPEIDKPILKEPPKSVALPKKIFDGDWDQVDDMNRFLNALFEDDEYIGTCTEFFDRNGRRTPTRGLFQRTKSQIQNVLGRTNNVSSAVGRYRRSDGAFVRINPLDGKGVGDANVTAFRNVLVECDTMSLEEQYAFIQALNLPTRAIVFSGGKSLHAVVRVDASTLEEYQERVALIFAECKAAGFDIDASTKNPSRFMRLPGIRRGNGRQALVSVDEGASSFDEWREWCELNRAE